MVVRPGLTGTFIVSDAATSGQWFTTVGRLLEAHTAKRPPVRAGVRETLDRIRSREVLGHL
ncbi:hypothetical protein, partial [Brevundimonas sp.]|uniref:hypothetical protein n=1 Tax=Brevundimonas sp. TaxID=1871086 RepID=UPI0025C327FD